MPYTIEEHKHRFAAWAAGRAASVNGCRFEVESAKRIIEAVKLNHLLEHPDNLPSPEELDEKHKEWRKSVIAEAQKIRQFNNTTQEYDVRLPDFTHGVAAKLINVYLKAGFVCGGFHEHPKVLALHPPIDSVLLDALYRYQPNGFGGLRQQWNEARNIRWSNFSSENYQAVIDNIREAMPNQGLWVIEQFWQGHQ